MRLPFRCPSLKSVYAQVREFRAILFRAHPIVPRQGRSKCICEGKNCSAGQRVRQCLFYLVAHFFNEIQCRCVHIFVWKSVSKTSVSCLGYSPVNSLCFTRWKTYVISHHFLGRKQTVFMPLGWRSRTRGLCWQLCTSF